MEKENQGFTLIEMLTVVILIGIILAIAVPGVMNAVKSNQKKLYDTHLKIVEEASYLFVKQYKGQLENSSSSCFLVDYQTLVQKGLVKESKITCSGKVILTKSGNGKDFIPTFSLECKDEDDKTYSKKDTIPGECVLFQEN